MSDRIKVAVLSGGDTEERVVSEKSAKVVHNYLPKDRYDARLLKGINGLTSQPVKILTKTIFP